MITRSPSVQGNLVVVTPAAPVDTVRAGDLEIRPSHFLVLARGRVVYLTTRELALLTCLARSGGRVLSREELFSAVWGGRLRASDRSVDVYVHKLRCKLARALPDWEYIHTHFGFGYRFSPVRSQVVHKTATTR